MPLGEKLIQTLKEIEEAETREAEARDAAQAAKIRKEREACERLVARAKEHIETKIEGGGVPAFKIENYDHQKWVRAGQAGTARHQDIWDGLQVWAHDEMLDLVLRDDHDGVGMKSWITLTVAPSRF